MEVSFLVKVISALQLHADGKTNLLFRHSSFYEVYDCARVASSCV